MIVITGKIQLYPKGLYEKGMALITVPTTRNFANAINPAIKSLNYLNNILAKIEAKIGGCEEAIMLNPEGFVAECTGDNVFAVQEGRLLTPPLSAGALRGITRGAVLDLASEQGIDTAEPALSRYDLYCADECFITGTAAEIVPIVKIDGRVIGNGRPGKLTRRFIRAYHALTEASGEPI